LHVLGAFDGARLVGKAIDLEHTYYYGGRAVPGSGVAGVAIAPEFRGGGVLGNLLGPLMAQARERGAVISALFPTTAIPYRRLGWELTGVLRWTSVPTATLAGERGPDGMTVRPAEEADVPAILECYRGWATEGTGMLGRTGVLFDRAPADLLTGHNGYSVAEGPNGVEGYASWDRDGGYDDAGVLTVPDLVATTPRALTALLAMLGNDGFGRPGRPIPVVLTGSRSENGGKLEIWSRNEGGSGVRKYPLEEFSGDEKLVGYQWILLHPWESRRGEDEMFKRTYTVGLHSPLKPAAWREIKGKPRRVIEEWLFAFAHSMAESGQLRWDDDDLAFSRYASLHPEYRL
jgi:N-acetylglutamate synthase-like GNAT family acetyltransferase